MILKIGNDYCAVTLVEILIVVCILSIIAGISFPMFSKTFDNIALKNSASDLAYLMRLAYFKAISENCDYRLYFDRSSNNYWLAKKDKKDFIAINDRFGKIKHFSKNLKFDACPEFIDFKANAQVEPFQIVLKNSLKKTISIINEKEIFDVKILQS